MEITDDKKVDILINLLKERYDAAHKIRDRSFKFTVWLLGIGVALVGFVVTKPCLSIMQKCFLTGFTVLIALLALFFLKSMESGAKKNWKVMVKIEEGLGCYRANFYGCENAIYPDDYMVQNSSRIKHFNYLYVWLFSIASCVMALLWVS